MRKLIIAAGVAVLASLGVVSRANAQAFYPSRSASTPVTQGRYGTYPSQYPTYPAQYPSATRPRQDDRRDVRRDRDADDRDRSNYDVSGRYNERTSGYGYGTRGGVSGQPSRIAEHQGSAQSSRSGAYNAGRDSNWNHDSRDRR